MIPHFLINVLSLGFVIFAFAGADTLQAESGLLSVTVMGILLANIKTPNLDKILDFKDIPENMINAIISAEDKTFFRHQGFDIKGIANAFIINLKNDYRGCR